MTDLGAKYLFRVHSPGRLCLIGEHVDYAGGQSIGMAIRLGTTLLARPSSCMGFTVDSDRYETVFDSTDCAPIDGWQHFIRAFMEISHGPLNGWAVHLKSDLPDGAGMSSSASLLVGLCYMQNLILNRPQNLMDTALLAQKIENEGLGVGCGLLDQLSVLAGKKGEVVHIQFDPLSTSPLQFPPEMGRFLVLHTGIKRSLGTSDYNNRPRECEEAFQFLKAKFSSLKNLASATEDQIVCLPDLLKKRASHVVNEVHRVTQALTAIEEKDSVLLGQLLNESHQSLSQLHEVSLPPIDDLIEGLQALPEVFGARLMGGGFGGSVIAMVDPDATEDILVQSLDLAETIDGISARAWLLDPADGVRVLKD